MDKNFIYTVTQLNNHSADILRNKLSNIWVKGEIYSLKKYSSGYTYFILKDLRSEISCISYSNNMNNIDSGMKVTVNGSVDLYTIKGQYQIKISSIYPEGEGELWIRYNSLKNKLENEGLFDSAIKKTLPKYPMNIGIMTSLEGSVINDITNIINRRAPYIKMIIKNIRVHGNDVSKHLIKSMKDFNKYIKNIDLIIIARGGGSFEDLMPFNDESFIRSVYNCKIPIISAIGHATDFTLCDFVSDIRASTPSEAAELACLDVKDITFKINNNYSKVREALEDRFEKKKSIINSFYNILINFNRKNLIKDKYVEIMYLNRIAYKSFINIIENFNLKLHASKKIFSSLNIEKIKKMGFSIIRKKNHIISNVTKLKINDLLKIELSNGEIFSEVRKINEDK